MHLGAYFEGKELVNSVAYGGSEWRFGKDVDPRLVHRLDKDVTGVLLLARTRRAAVTLSTAFNPESPKSVQVEKTYLAVVHGSPASSQGILNRPIRYGDDGIPHLAKLSEAPQDGHKAAQTSYWVLESAGGYSLVALRPLSGRKHQLRLHLAQELGMPIVGDLLYQPSPSPPEHSILLHCFCIKLKVSLSVLSGWFALLFNLGR